MDEYNTQQNIKTFNLFLRKMTTVQLIFSLFLVVICILLWSLFKATTHQLTIVGTGIVGIVLLLESFFLKANPFVLTTEKHKRADDLDRFEYYLQQQLKLFGIIFGITVLLTIILLILLSNKWHLPVCIPIIILTAVQLAKVQVILFRSWIMKDEIKRTE